jgi:hypothetical protein
MMPPPIAITVAVVIFAVEVAVRRYQNDPHLGQGQPQAQAPRGRHSLDMRPRACAPTRRIAQSQLRPGSDQIGDSCVGSVAIEMAEKPAAYS